MAITASMVKELREITGVGMMECKNALAETDGNIEKAVELLREKGLAAAAKKAGRIAAEGLVVEYITEDNSVGALVEINSETDFVAKNEAFREFSSQVAKQATETKASTVEEFLQDQWKQEEAKTIGNELTQKISVTGENLNIRRFVKFEKSEPGVLVSYIHGGGRIAVLLEMGCQNQSDMIIEAGKNLAMQIAALNPKHVTRNEVPADYIEKEREILKQQALNEGKPANIVEKMIEGRLVKQLKDICLIDQGYVKDSDLTVEGYLKAISKEVGAEVTVRRFARFETGEGIEKKSENFADEVSKLM